MPSISIDRRLTELENNLFIKNQITGSLSKTLKKKMFGSNVSVSCIEKALSFSVMRSMAYSTNILSSSDENIIITGQHEPIIDLQEDVISDEEDLPF